MTNESNFDKVGEFRKKFALATVDETLPNLLSHEDFLFRYDLCSEELHELLKAHRKGSVVEFADALADLLYVIYGLAHESGVPIDDVFDEVHRTNMLKIKHSRENPSKRNHASDVVKPPGWTPPQIGEILSYAAERHRQRHG